jgi:quercetin dioxygenase-like cupin family protein
LCVRGKLSLGNGILFNSGDHDMTIGRSVLLLTLTIPTFLLCASAAEQPANSQPHTKVVTLDPAAKDYLQVLGGPPESVRMKAGYVVLAPGKSVGKHSTEHHEELLVVLQGEGQMTFHDGSTLPLKAESAVYCPPETEHNVTNTGHDTLRYVYVVSETP